MKIRWISLIVLVMLVLISGCQTNSSAGTPPENIASPAVSLQNTTAPDTGGQKIATPDRISEAMKKTPERVPTTEATTPITGEVAAKFLDPILKDLAERTSKAPDKISVIQAQEVVWNDGSLGCPQPGVIYTQALVHGYWVILEVEGQKFDYRATDKGYFFLCENGFRPVFPTDTPSS
jgi:hypothetical protein